MRDKDVYLSVVIPAYNEGNIIRSTLTRIVRYLENKNYAFEIIVVDDGSIDDTLSVIEDLSPDIHKYATLIHLDKNQGKGFAVKKGVLSACGEYLLVTDADLSAPIEDMDRLLEGIQEGFDFVIGSRRVGGSRIIKNEPPLRIFMGRAYHYLAAGLLLKGVRDYNCGFKLFRKACARELFSRILSKDYTFDVEMLYLAGKSGLKFKEVPVTWTHNPRSKVRPFIDGGKSLFSLVKIKLRHK